jgi:predicted O-linked N-acetylglucosamine transferase (SPINDLY family)
VSYLTAELFERHDRSQFEITAFSFCLPRYDPSARITLAFDRFVNAYALSDRECVERARSLELDIAVDLAGYTEHSRSNVFALRAAPLQLHYIGFLGTMSADFMDYMIADRELIAPQDEAHYTEKIIYLPSYQVNDTQRVSSCKTYHRTEWGLPQSGFVYCCFNACKKINPRMFDAWMRILQQVPGSVLWLHEDNPDQLANLRKEAINRGVDAGRLVFARFLPLADYRARYALADLFLDTLPYNAGATGSDALWAGLPLLTCRGDTFAGRYGASMLHALDLSELITDDLPAYEAKAVALGTQAHQLARVREKLAHGRAHGRLFDIARFTQTIETAYKMIHERHHRGLPPATITV